MDTIVQGFQFEPDRVSNGSEIDRGRIHSIEVRPERERVLTLDWCQCSNCIIMPTEKECLCCQEMLEVGNLYDSEGLKCVIEYCDFVPIVLSKGNLYTSLVARHDTQNKGLKNINEVSNRYSAYRQFCYWVHNRLGKGVRRVIPSCVVNEIRTVYPDPNGLYVGFKEYELSEMEFAWPSGCD